MTTRLVSEILSREDYITLASQVNQFSDAMNLLESLAPMLVCYSLRRLRVLDSATIDMNGRAKRFELAVISKMGREPQFNIPYDPHSNVLPSLFYILNNVEVRSISITGCILLRNDSLDILLQE